VKSLAIVGLGNPEEKYLNTRHNVGFMVVDYLREYFRFDPWRKVGLNLISSGSIIETKIFLIKPQTYMNLSGKGVKEFLEAHPLESKDLLIIQDDLDLPSGILRIRFDGKDGGHNGIRSIISELATTDFYRLRIGIGKPESKELTISYVLSEFTKEEKEIIDKIIKLSPEIIETIIKDGWETAQRLYNRRCHS